MVAETEADLVGGIGKIAMPENTRGSPRTHEPRSIAVVISVEKSRQFRIGLLSLSESGACKPEPALY